MINAKVIGSSPEGDREATPGPIRAREQVTRRDLPQKLPPFCQTWRWHATSDAHQGFAGRLGERPQAAAKRWARLDAKMSTAPRKAAGKAEAAMPVQPKTSSKTPEK